MLFSKMRKQNIQPKNYQNSKQLTNISFSLADLIDLVPPANIFALQSQQIQFNASENFTFGTEWYTIKLRKSSDNSKRILYYSLMCYIFQICNDCEAQQFQKAFVEYVIGSIQLILPYRYHFDQGLQISTPLLTTNQIKACFMKFVNLLRQRQKKQKLVLQEILILPQIDFVFMSIFQTIVKKGNKNLHEGLSKIEKEFGIKYKVHQSGFSFNDACQIEIKSSDDEWDKFYIKKINTTKQKISNSLKRKETTESVGQIQINEQPATQDEINECLHYEELINARFVESCQTEQIKKLQQDSFKQERDFIKGETVVEYKPFSKKQNNHTQSQTTVIAARSPFSAKRKSFLNQNLFHYPPVQKSKGKQRMKTQMSSKKLILSNEIRLGSFKPWSTKNSNNVNNEFNFQVKNQKSFEIKDIKNCSKQSKTSFCLQACSFYRKDECQQKANLVQRFPLKRQTLQKLTFNYGYSFITTT